MPKLSEIYKNKIHLIVVDTINNYVNSTHINPDENQFRGWLNNKKLYYSNRITNKLVSKWKPKDVTQAKGYIAMEIDEIKGRDYESK